MNKEYTRNDEIPVGSIMTRKNGKKYMTIIADGCTPCAFDKKGANWCQGIECAGPARTDGNNVVFIRRKDLEMPE